jgi:hypothetical protein
VTCNTATHLTLSQSTEKLQQFEISFDGKKSAQSNDFWQF